MLHPYLYLPINIVSFNTYFKLITTIGIIGKKRSSPVSPILARPLAPLGVVQGSCERIANTQLPFVYTLLVHRTSYIYILLAPFAMASEMGWWTPVFNTVVAYTFFGLDELARQLAHPFGEESQCLALESICRPVVPTTSGLGSNE